MPALGLDDLLRITNSCYHDPPSYYHWVRQLTVFLHRGFPQEVVMEALQRPRNLKVLPAICSYYENTYQTSKSFYRGRGPLNLLRPELPDLILVTDLLSGFNKSYLFGYIHYFQADLPFLFWLEVCIYYF